MNQYISKFIKQYGYRNVVLLAYVYTLMGPMNLTSTLLILYFMVVLYECHSVIKNNFLWKAYIFTCIPGLIIMINFLLNPDYYSLKELEKNITFFIIPFCAIADYRNIRKLFFPIVKALFFGVIVLEVISIIGLLIQNGFASLPDYLMFNFDNEYLSYYINLHHTYFSLLISISLLGFIFFHREFKPRRNFMIILFVFSFIYNFLLSARTILLVFIILLGFLAYKRFRLGISIVFFGLLVLTYFYQNKDTYSAKRITISHSLDDFNKRLNLAQVSLELFKKSPITGVGPGRARYERLDAYKEIGYISAYKELYNSHNQYLEFLGVYGLLGFLPFLFVTCYTLYYSFKRRQWFISTSFVLFYLSCFTESYLVRNKGIVLFSFLIMLFLVFNIESIQSYGKRKTGITNK